MLDDNIIDIWETGLKSGGKMKINTSPVETVTKIPKLYKPLVVIADLLENHGGVWLENNSDIIQHLAELEIKGRSEISISEWINILDDSLNRCGYEYYFTSLDDTKKQVLNLG